MALQQHLDLAHKQANPLLESLRRLFRFFLVCKPGESNSGCGFLEGVYSGVPGEFFWLLKHHGLELAAVAANSVLNRHAITVVNVLLCDEF